MDEAYTDDDDTKTGHCVEAKTGHCGEAKTGHCGEAKTAHCGEAKTAHCGEAKTAHCGPVPASGFRLPVLVPVPVSCSGPAGEGFLIPRGKLIRGSG